MTTPTPAKPLVFLGREPAQWSQLTSGLLIFLIPILHWTTDQTGAANAVVTAFFGILTATAVSRERVAAAAAALIKALIALALALRFHLDPSLQSGGMVLVESIAAWWLRTQVTAPPERQITQ